MTNAEEASLKATPSQFVDDFLREARHLLQPVLNDSGAILYSSVATLAPGRFYLLGLNPGGDPDERTIGESLAGLPSHAENDYLDEPWAGYVEGRSPVQQCVQTLAGWLGVNVREICASNLVFRRTHRAEGIRPNEEELYWPVHKLILNTVDPDILLVFGVGNPSPCSFLLTLHERTQGQRPRVTFAPDDGRYSLPRTFMTALLGRDRRVIAFPHFSYYPLRQRGCTANWVRDLVGIPTDRVRDP